MSCQIKKNVGFTDTLVRTMKAVARISSVVVYAKRSSENVDIISIITCSKREHLT